MLVLGHAVVKGMLPVNGFKLRLPRVDVILHGNCLPIKVKSGAVLLVSRHKAILIVTSHVIVFYFGDLGAVQLTVDGGVSVQLASLNAFSQELGVFVVIKLQLGNQVRLQFFVIWIV